MNRLVSLVFLSVGTVLVIYGINASESIGSAFSRFVSGVPNDSTFWLLGAGLAALVIGLGGLARTVKFR